MVKQNKIWKQTKLKTGQARQNQKNVKNIKNQIKKSEA